MASITYHIDVDTSELDAALVVVTGRRLPLLPAVFLRFLLKWPRKMIDVRCAGATGDRIVMSILPSESLLSVVRMVQEVDAARK